VAQFDWAEIAGRERRVYALVPDALAHGVEIQADSMVTALDIGPDGACTGVTYSHDGRERRQGASAVAIAGHSIESPRLLLNSDVGNGADQVGGYVMVQGASQVAGRFPETMRMYKGPPPEVSSEQFYETDRSRGFAIQTVSPCRSGGPSTSWPTGTGARPCASTCATTTTGQSPARCPSCFRFPATA
jgi:choline dehydrogenase-like flavoprotein